MIKMLKVLNIYSFSRVDSSTFREVVSNFEGSKEKII